MPNRVVGFLKFIFFSSRHTVQPTNKSEIVVRLLVTSVRCLVKSISPHDSRIGKKKKL